MSWTRGGVWLRVTRTQGASGPDLQPLLSRAHCDEIGHIGVGGHGNGMGMGMCRDGMAGAEVIVHHRLASGQDGTLLPALCGVWCGLQGALCCNSAASSVSE